MSNRINNSLFEQFMDTLTEVVVCPYCGKPNQLDPALLCCGEVHAETMWDDGSDYIEHKNLGKAFDRWVETYTYPEPIRDIDKYFKVD